MKKHSHDDASVRQQQALWQYRGKHRPPFAREPGPGQESVWDYPRPPAMVPDKRLVEVRVGATLIARTHQAVRVLETASPPTFYIPPGDVDMGLLHPASGQSFCEWKGRAHYYDLVTPHARAGQVAWSYAEPFEAFADIAGYLAFYPGRVECTIDGERVRAQAGGFYGGWITNEVVGPFKGDPGTTGW